MVSALRYVLISSFLETGGRQIVASVTVRFCGRCSNSRRVATCYDRCPMVFLSAVALAATVIFWL